MASLSAKLSYVKDRVVNAYGMLRRGEFNTMASSAKQELDHRWEYLSGKTRHYGILGARSVRIAGLQARHHSILAARRMRHLRAPAAGVESAPAGLEEPNRLIPFSAFVNRRKVVPSSYSPTRMEPYEPASLDIDKSALLNSLSAIAGRVAPAPMRHR